MDYSVATLGRGIVRRLQERADSPIVVIGTDKFSRGDLASVGNFNFVAAARLNAVLARLPRARKTLDVFRYAVPEDFAVPNIGGFAFAVLGACFELKGVGTLDAWVERSRKKGTKVTTFQTIKTRIAKDTTKSTRKERSRRRGMSPHAVAADDTTPDRAST